MNWPYIICDYWANQRSAMVIFFIFEFMISEITRALRAVHGLHSNTTDLHVYSDETVTEVE